MATKNVIRLCRARIDDTESETVVTATKGVIATMATPKVVASRESSVWMIRKCLRFDSIPDADLATMDDVSLEKLADNAGAIIMREAAAATVAQAMVEEMYQPFYGTRAAVDLNYVEPTNHPIDVALAKASGLGRTAKQEDGYQEPVHPIDIALAHARGEDV